MPTYEYRCPEGHTFDVFQKMSDDPVATCPECGKKAERVISGGAGFLFKGEGFYITDYRSKEYRERAKAEKPGTAPDSGSAGEKAAGSGTSSSGDGGSSGSASSSDGGSGGSNSPSHGASGGGSPGASSGSSGGSASGTGDG